MARTKDLRRRMRGGDWDIPTVLTAQEVLDKAFHRATKVSVEDKSSLHRARKTAMARVDSISDTIDAVLLRTVKTFPSVDGLHPFYREVLATQVDLDDLKRALSTVDWCRGQVKDVCTTATRQLKRTRSREFVETKRREVYGRVSSLLERVSGELALLQETRAVLRSLPAIDPAVSTAVVAGSPNVGKSALVARLSSAEPDVASYPFTTKAVSVGHFFDRGHPYQVVDTPGLLDRPPEEQNPIERRALAAIGHLPHVLVFLLDPSGTCGTDMPTQLELLEEVRRRFPEAQVVEVETKVDLARDEGTDRLKVSARTDEGVDELRKLLVELLPRRKVEWVIREG